MKPNDSCLEAQLQQAAQKEAEQHYQQLVKKVKPRPPVLRNALGAFAAGGLICTLGQAIAILFQKGGLSPPEATTATLVLLIFLGALLTGLGVYDRLTQIGGAGTIIPITGFSNSIVSPALEFKREGFVLGVGARMFTVAGPVLVYGFIASVLIGLFTYFLS